MWRDISTEGHFNIGLSLLPFRTYIRGETVRQVHFDCGEISSWYKPGEPDTTRVIDFLLAQECFYLQKVFMRAAFESESTFSKFVFLTGRDTITELEIDCKDREVAAMLVLDAVLRYYPNLERCACKTHRDWPVDRTGLFENVKPHQHLQQLAIHLSGYRPLPIDRIVQYMPKLRRISSTSLICEDVDPILQHIMASCPDIEHINLGGTLEQSSSRMISTRISPRQGLRSLYICHRRRWRGIGLIHVMERYHHTLESLSIFGDLGLHPHVMARLASLSFPRLDTLILAMTDGGSEAVDYNINMAAFLRQSTRLRHLHLAKSSANDIVFLNGLQQLCSLRQLVIDDCTFVTDTALMQLLSHQPHLTDLTLKHTAAVTDDVLERIGTNCTALKTLHIDSPVITIYGLKRWMDTRGNGSCHRLESLEVYCSAKDHEEMLESILDRMSDYAIQWQFGTLPQQDRQCYQIVFTHQTWLAKRLHLFQSLYKEVN
ncbi:hypothetical protein LRAMOSA07944 [Lichtheimia ramosa]|uniref:RNI-like protein n=1 Tax=Lichtheimia ramosa TaxID=688394 RepID=A0A077WCH2_9FUNG|nr:hypothetical protein LRAMOSA07944 [Lichtheimia ramosa]